MKELTRTIQIKAILRGFSRFIPNWSCNPARRANPPVKNMLTIPRIALPCAVSRPMIKDIRRRTRNAAPAATMPKFFRPVSSKIPTRFGITMVKDNIGSDLAMPFPKNCIHDTFVVRDWFSVGGIIISVTIYPSSRKK